MGHRRPFTQLTNSAVLSLVATLLVKTPLESGRGVAKRALEEKLLSEKELEDILKPELITQPRRKPAKQKA